MDELYTDTQTHNMHTHKHFMALFWDYPAEPVPEEIFWTFMVQGKTMEADTPTTRVGTILS